MPPANPIHGRDLPAEIFLQQFLHFTSHYNERSFVETLTIARPSKLCKYLILKFRTSLKIFGGQLLMETFWWKTGGKCLVENIQWNLVGGKWLVECEGTSWLGARVDCWGRVGREKTRLLRPTEAAMPVYIFRLLTWTTEASMPVYMEEN